MILENEETNNIAEKHLMSLIMTNDRKKYSNIGQFISKCILETKKMIQNEKKILTNNTLKLSTELTKSTSDNNHYGQFLHSLIPHKGKTMRTLEKLNKKFRKFSLSVRFNEACICLKNHQRYHIQREVFCYMLCNISTCKERKKDMPQLVDYIVS